MDDFIDYGEEGRPTRRKQSGVSRELEEAREEADAIFGTDAEMQELLDFTRGDKNVDYDDEGEEGEDCLLYTSPSPRDRQKSRMPSSA